MIECNLKEIMDRKGISISELSKRTGFCRQAIRNYRENNLRKMTVSKVVIICSVLDCSVEDLFKFL